LIPFHTKLTQEAFMLKFLRKWWPSRTFVARLTFVLGLVAVGLAGYLMGRGVLVGTARSQDRRLPLGQQAEGDYSQRVVAWVHDTIPITREELGEFLIHRFGASRLDNLVNRRVAELACRPKGIEVTDAEVEAHFRMDFNKAKAISPTMTLKDYENIVWSRSKRNLTEFKEDVIRLKLMMAKLVAPTIEVSEDDLRKGFEGRYGPRVECRMIVLPDNSNKYRVWEQVSQSEAAFMHAAKTINMPPLNANEGKVPPIHKHFGDQNIERIAFNLKVGEVSPLIGMPDKTVVILKCDKHIPADETKRFENEVVALREEIFNIKLNQRSLEAIGELRRAANPRLMIQAETRQEDLERSVLPEIRGGAAPKQGG
jgi:hypothetical protein